MDSLKLNELLQSPVSATTGENDTTPANRRQALRALGRRNEALRPPNLRVVLDDRGVARHQLPIARERGKHGEIPIINRVRNEVADAPSGVFRDRAFQVIGPSAHEWVRNEADRSPGLPLQHSNQIWIRHWRERIVALWRFRNELATKEQM